MGHYQHLGRRFGTSHFDNVSLNSIGVAAFGVTYIWTYIANT